MAGLREPCRLWGLWLAILLIGAGIAMVSSKAGVDTTGPVCHVVGLVLLSVCRAQG